MLESRPKEPLLEVWWIAVCRRRLGRSEALRMVGFALNPSDMLGVFCSREVFRLVSGFPISSLPLLPVLALSCLVPALSRLSQSLSLPVLFSLVSCCLPRPTFCLSFLINLLRSIRGIYKLALVQKKQIDKFLPSHHLLVAHDRVQ